MSGDGNETRGGTRGTATNEREGQFGSRIHIEYADGYADRENIGGGETSRL